MNEVNSNEILNLTTDIVTAHVSNNAVASDDVPAIIEAIYATLSRLSNPEKLAEKQEPAVSIRASIKPDYIVCLEDGKKLKMLKRHLMANYNMTPAEYRAKWNLPHDYPMVAPNYAAVRRKLAKAIGLGRKPGDRPVAARQASAATAGAPSAAPKKAAPKKPSARAAASQSSEVATKPAAKPANATRTVTKAASAEKAPAAKRRPAAKKS